MVTYDGWSHGYPYIIGTAVRDHVKAYTANGGQNWGTVGNDTHWAPGHNGDHTSKPGDPTRPQPYITANDSWTGGSYDHDDFAFNFLLPRLKAGFYKNQVKFFNCSNQQWSANNGFKSKQGYSEDVHLHISFMGTGMFRWTGTDEYFMWKADGRPDPRTWVADGIATREVESAMATVLVGGKPHTFLIGTDGWMYYSTDQGEKYTAILKVGNSYKGPWQSYGVDVCSPNGNDILVSGVASEGRIFLQYFPTAEPTSMDAAKYWEIGPLKYDATHNEVAEGQVSMVANGDGTVTLMFKGMKNRIYRQAGLDPKNKTMGYLSEPNTGARIA